MSFKIGDLVRVVSMEELEKQGFYLNSLGRRCINKIGVVQAVKVAPLLPSSIRKLRISFIEKDGLVSAGWVSSLIKKVVSFKNNVFEI